MSETISIAMATYNGARFIREQLDSLYNQTRKPDEIVVCDDGSTDGTIDILEEYHQKYGLRYYINNQNLGVNPNFIHAFSLCKGDYVFICDQDDIWFDNKIETHYNIIKDTDPNIPIVVSSSRVDVNAQGTPIGEPRVKPYKDKWEDTIISTDNSQGCTMLLNRCLVDKVIKLYDKEASKHVMYDVLVSLTASACGIKINTGIPLMYYRHHDKNVIDKYRENKKTFAEKVHDMPTYYPFLLDYRIKELAYANEFLEGESVNPEVKDFLKKMVRLDNTNNMFRALSIILPLKQLTLKRKVKIAILTPISCFLKRIYHCNKK